MNRRIKAQIQKTEKCLRVFIKKNKKDYYELIDISNITSFKEFWKPVKTVFGSKI